MINFSKTRIIILVVTVGLILLAVFQSGFYAQKTEVNPEDTTSQEIKVLKTVPDPLNETTILPNQTLEITFSQPLENVPELRMTIEPVAEVKVELSDDRKTAKFIPIKPYSLGQGYTLTIKSDSKFDGKKTLGRDEVFRFKTINYTGV